MRERLLSVQCPMLSMCILNLCGFVFCVAALIHYTSTETHSVDRLSNGDRGSSIFLSLLKLICCFYIWKWRLHIRFSSELLNILFLVDLIFLILMFFRSEYNFYWNFLCSHRIQNTGRKLKRPNGWNQIRGQTRGHLHE